MVPQTEAITDSVPWVTVEYNTKIKLLCKRCCQDENIKLPISLSELPIKLKEFGNIHSRCQLLSEGFNEENLPRRSSSY